MVNGAPGYKSPCSSGAHADVAVATRQAQAKAPYTNRNRVSTQSSLDNFPDRSKAFKIQLTLSTLTMQKEKLKKHVYPWGEGASQYRYEAPLKERIRSR
jgi:hypothetical protein